MKGRWGTSGSSGVEPIALSAAVNMGPTTRGLWAERASRHCAHGPAWEQILLLGESRLARPSGSANLPETKGLEDHVLTAERQLAPLRVRLLQGRCPRHSGHKCQES